MSTTPANDDNGNLDGLIDTAIKAVATDPIPLVVAARASGEQRMRFGFSMMLLSIFVLILASLRLSSRPAFDTILLAHACLLMTVGIWAVDRSSRSIKTTNASKADRQLKR